MNPLEFTVVKTVTKTIGTTFYISVTFKPNFVTNSSSVVMNLEIGTIFRDVIPKKLIIKNQENQDELFDCISGGYSLAGSNPDFNIKYPNMGIDYVLNFSTDSAFVISDSLYLLFSIFADPAKFR